MDGRKIVTIPSAPAAAALEQRPEGFDLLRDGIALLLLAFVPRF